MPRLFTGLALPDVLARELATVRGGLSGARWGEHEDYHVTLRFIGDVGEATAHEIHALLERISRPAFDVDIDGLGAFGGARPRALVALVKPTRALSELQGEQERLMRRVGLPPETRKYTPHVTLARLRHTSSEAVADFLTLRGFAAGWTFKAEHFTLFSARESVGGGPYVAEADYPLR